MESLRAAWEARTPRDRSALAFGAVALVALLLYGFVWEPWRMQQAQLREQLPRLRAQAAQFATDAAEAARLRERARPAAVGEQARAAIESSAVEAGVRPQVKSISEAAGGRFRVTLEPVAYDAFIRWIGALAAGAGIAIESLQLRAGATPGMVAVDALVLKMPGGER
jgi:general secretion pathway protein M